MDERDRIAQLHYRGFGPGAIAAALGRAGSTISRELQRNAVGEEYHAAQAQAQAERRRRERPLERKMDHPETDEFVRRGLANYWSPEQIAGRLKLEFPDQPERHVAAQTIYTWIAGQDREDRNHWHQFLRRRGRRPRRKRENAEVSAQRAKIAERPQVIEQRGRLGDFEGDTVLGPPGTGGLVTLVDRRSRYSILTKTKNKEARRVRKRIQQRLQQLPATQRRSLTFDGGKEFACCDLLEARIGVKIYTAEPGRPYQRGTNENTNGLIRQYFPKGTNFRDISYVEVQRVENLLNNRPRACLGYRTPNEIQHGTTPLLDCD
jgi:IS30 family transposase